MCKQDTVIQWFIVCKQDHVSFPWSYNMTYTHEMKVPTYQMKVPAYEMKVPAYEMKVPAYEMKVPAYAMKAPAYEMKVPAYEMKVPAYEMKVPAYEMKVPTYEMKVPAYKMKVPAYKMKVPAYKMKVPRMLRIFLGKISTRCVSVSKENTHTECNSILLQANTHTLRPDYHLYTYNVYIACINIK
jgi:hypothetical protein